MSMESKSFQEIRKQFPNEFLVLVEPEENHIDANWIEVTGAKEVYAYSSGDQMLQAYQKMKKEGKRVRFCTPDYKNDFKIEQIKTLGVFGA